MALADDMAAWWVRGDGRRDRPLGPPLHPSPHAGDVRFTTRLDRSSPLSSIGAVMHELGHALYEQGLPADVDRTPLHDARPRWGPTSRSRASGRTSRAHARVLGALEPYLRRRFPRR